MRGWGSGEMGGASDLSALSPLDGERKAVFQEGRLQGCGNEAVGAAAAGGEEDCQSCRALPHPSPAQTLAFPKTRSSKNRCLALGFYFY